MKQSKNQLANLEKGKQFSGEYARTAATKSAKTRAIIKPLRELVQAELNNSNSQYSKQELAKKLMQMAIGGNIKAFELILKLIGEYPSENVNLNVNGHVDSLETQKMLKEFEELRKNAKKHMDNGMLH